jgi:hypothetical protein
MPGIEHHVDGASYDVGIAAESLLPVGPADHRHRAVPPALARRLIVIGGQGAADHWRNAERLVEIAGYPNAPSLFARAIDHDFHVGRTERSDGFEAGGSIAEQFEVRIGWSVASVGAGGLDEHKPGRVAHRQYAEHDRIHESEDRGVGPDAKCERQDSDRGKARIPAQCTEGKAKVRTEFIHPLQPPSLAAFVLGGFNGSEFEAGAALGLLSIDAGADQVGDVGVDMKPELDIHVALELFAAPEAHEPSGTAPRTLATTIEKRFQDSASALSCFRPVAVSV